MKKPIVVGTHVRHAVFGLGSTLSSDESRTVIQFEEQGTRTFVTEMLQVERTDEVPRRPPRVPKTKSR